MVAVLFLIVIALVLFWILPLGIAIAVAVVIAILVATSLYDAVNRGRAVLAARKKDKSAKDTDSYENATVFHAMWIGLTVAGSSHHHGTGLPGQHGDDFGGGFGGGSGDGGGDGGGL